MTRGSRSCALWEGQVHAAAWRQSARGWGLAPADVSLSIFRSGQCLFSGYILKPPPLAALWQTVQEWKINQGHVPPAPTMSLSPSPSHITPLFAHDPSPLTLLRPSVRQQNAAFEVMEREDMEPHVTWVSRSFQGR